MTVLAPCALVSVILCEPPKEVNIRLPLTPPSSAITSLSTQIRPVESSASSPSPLISILSPLRDTGRSVFALFSLGLYLRWSVLPAGPPPPPPPPPPPSLPPPFLFFFFL